jgi:two-component system, cell cycle sensor histidine kinase and response regulator CckA
MPKMNGPELYHRLQDLIPGLKVLFISGYASSAMVRDGALDETVNFLPKPFSAEALLKRISGLIGHAAH